jgi:hypothetical protein
MLKVKVIISLLEMCCANSPLVEAQMHGVALLGQILFLLSADLLCRSRYHKVIIHQHRAYHVSNNRDRYLKATPYRRFNLLLHLRRHPKDSRAWAELKSMKKPRAQT